MKGGEGKSKVKGSPAFIEDGFGDDEDNEGVATAGDVDDDDSCHFRRRV